MSKPITPLVRVFVYGTLRQGGSNFGLLAHCARMAGPQLLAGYAMYYNGGLPYPYPYAVATGLPTDYLLGEVYAVDAATLARLDELEGLSEGNYVRAHAPAADAYIYLKANTEGLAGLPKITHGDWLRAVREQQVG
ncbi:MAG: gamma-glutamylcyclotransferase [Bernardetiaceae bacterium]|jgi:gamma-glutamylcyclotransferase (GGCT)/AIG2-like uncharacterized protein YtfP|nr:gamma-glutamylcyclotransferase [Bernardetiaceae bacterium]